MRVLVTGDTGQIVSALKERCPEGIDLMTTRRQDMDLTRAESIRSTVTALRPDLLISAAAYTSVDRAEGERDLAFAVNRDGPMHLARLCGKMGIPIIHLSTDYVFDGLKTSAYLEDDAPVPLNVYGLSKLAGEQALAEMTDNHVILRTSWVYSRYGDNFVKSMLRLSKTQDKIAVVADQTGGPSYALDIADAIYKIILRLNGSADANLRGIFHLTSPDYATWFDLAEGIFAGLEARGAGRQVTLEKITSRQYVTPALRPQNSCLNCNKISHHYGVELSPWRTSLDICLDALIGNQRKNCHP